MRIHPDTTFTPADSALLASHGYCVGYDLDGKPMRAMAVHPETGIIVRSFFKGCSIWHPALNRRDEIVRHGGIADVLTNSSRLKRVNSYTSWHNRSKNWTRLSNLRDIAATNA